jgi:hypothetical protein
MAQQIWMKLVKLCKHNFMYTKPYLVQLIHYTKKYFNSERIKSAFLNNSISFYQNWNWKDHYFLGLGLKPAMADWMLSCDTR